MEEQKRAAGFGTCPMRVHFPDGHIVQAAFGAMELLDLLQVPPPTLHLALVLVLSAIAVVINLMCLSSLVSMVMSKDVVIN